MKTISKNRKARHDYFIEGTWEAGLCLKGSEVKAMRHGLGSIGEGYAIVRDGEAWLINTSVPALKHASYMNHSERRDRKILLNRKEIDKLDIATRQKGYTLVPLELYFDDNNRIKVELGLAKGKAHHDKRQSEKEKNAKKEAARAVKR